MIASDALRGDPQLTEVDADRAFALSSASLTPDQHINTELYRLVPSVDPGSDGKAVRFYSAQNRETGQFDWTVPPGSLDAFVGNESERMNIAAYSRMMGGTTPSNIEVQRMLRDGSNGDVAGMASHFGKSWKEGLKDPLFYLNTAGGVAAGSAAKAVGPARAMTIAEGSSGRAVARVSQGLPARPTIKRRTAADFAGHADSEAGGAPSPFRRVTPTNDVDAGAQAFADRYGGQASVKIEGFSNREFDMVSDQYVGQAFGPMKQGQAPAFEVNAKNFLSKSRRAQIRATLEASHVTQKSALFEFSGGKPAAEVSEFIQRNAERMGVQYRIELVE